MVKNSQLNKLFYLIFSLTFLFSFNAVHAEGGEVIQVGGLENLLWSIVKTIQFYTLPVMAIALAFLGIKLVTSGDDAHAKSEIKNWMGKIVIGAFIVFGATTIATLLKGALS